MDFRLFNPRELGNRIVRLRKENGLSRTSFANVLGVSSPSTIGKWERGENAPSLKSIVAICNIFSVDADALVFGAITGK